MADIPVQFNEPSAINLSLIDPFAIDDPEELTRLMHMLTEIIISIEHQIDMADAEQKQDGIETDLRWRAKALYAARRTGVTRQRCQERAASLRTAAKNKIRKSADQKFIAFIKQEAPELAARAWAQIDQESETQ